MSNQFDILLTVNSESGNEHLLRVTGTAYPYVPATGPTMDNAGGDPPEGGEIEDVEAFLVYDRKNRRRVERRLPDKMVDALKLDDKIYEELAESAGPGDDE